MKNRVLTGIAIMLLVWFILSYIDCMHSIDTQTYTYAEWNLITLLF
jgi:hypothetical protein